MKVYAMVAALAGTAAAGQDAQGQLAFLGGWVATIEAGAERAQTDTTLSRVSLDGTLTVSVRCTTTHGTNPSHDLGAFVTPAPGQNMILMRPDGTFTPTFTDASSGRVAPGGDIALIEAALSEGTHILATSSGMTPISFEGFGAMASLVNFMCLPVAN